MSELSKFPLWKQAIENFLKLNLKPGDVISKNWLMTEFGIPKPVTAEDLQAASLEFMKAMNAFRETLLEEHLIDLKSVHGQGYQVVPPHQQTRLALTSRLRNVASELNKMHRSIAFVDLSKLNDAERKENADGLAKAAAIKSMFSRRQLLGRD